MTPEAREEGVNRAFDLIQHRYGFTDEQILKLPYARFMDVVQIATKVRQEEVKQGYKEAAFQAYLQGGGQTEEGQEPLSFQQYLVKIGLEEPPEEERINENNTKEEALALAEGYLNDYKWGG